jgi:hypothetical protein
MAKTIVYDNTNSKINKYTSRLEMTAALDWQGKSIECYIQHPTIDNILSDKKNIDLNCK